MALGPIDYSPIVVAGVFFHPVCTFDTYSNNNIVIFVIFITFFRYWKCDRMAFYGIISDSWGENWTIPILSSIFIDPARDICQKTSPKPIKIYWIPKFWSNSLCVLLSEWRNFNLEFYGKQKINNMKIRWKPLGFHVLPGAPAFVSFGLCMCLRMNNIYITFAHWFFFCCHQFVIYLPICWFLNSKWSGK